MVFNLKGTGFVPYFKHLLRALKTSLCLMFSKANDSDEQNSSGRKRTAPVLIPASFCSSFPPRSLLGGLSLPTCLCRDISLCNYVTATALCKLHQDKSLHGICNKSCGCTETCFQNERNFIPEWYPGRIFYWPIYSGLIFLVELFWQGISLWTSPWRVKGKCELVGGLRRGVRRLKV